MTVSRIISERVTIKAKPLGMDFRWHWRGFAFMGFSLWKELGRKPQRLARFSGDTDYGKFLTEPRGRQEFPKTASPRKNYGMDIVK